MTHIPENARWFIADLVIEMIINNDEEEQDNVVHINVVLVRAKEAEEAYIKAIELGKEHEMEYINTDGNQVIVRFIGLRDLNVIHDELEHGAELTYESLEGLTQESIEALARPKQNLSIFRKDD